MKDLKHLYYFEKLLDDTYNDLARAGKEAGMHAIGHVCFQIPEPLLNLDGCFSTRLSSSYRFHRNGNLLHELYFV